MSRMREASWFRRIPFGGRGPVIGIAAPAADRRQALVAQVGAGRLPFTDVVFLGLLALVTAVALDPFNQLLVASNLGRWGPFFASLPVLAVAFYGRLFTRSLPGATVQGDLWRCLWPTLVFATWVLCASLYGRWVKHLDYTLMPMGLFAWMGAPLTAWLAVTARDPSRFASWVAWVMYGLAVLTATTNALFFRDAAIFHSVEHLVFPVLMLPFLVMRGWTLRILSLVVPVLAAIGLNKLTGYLLLVTCFAMLAFGLLAQHLMGLRDRLARWTIGYWATLASVVSAVAVVVLYRLVKGDLPDGNTRYRLHTYGKAIDKFIESPIWGQWFADSPVERFELFTVAATTQVLPTHNDSLDILAHGGVLGAGLFVLALGKVLLPALRLLADSAAWRSSTTLRGVLAMHAMTVCAAIPVFTLNPVLNNHNRAWSFWIHVGMSVAIVAWVRQARKRSG